MPEFRGRYRFRRVHKPKGDPAVDFSCGDGPYEDEINKLVRNQFVGEKCARYPAIWVLEDITGGDPKTMGISAWVLSASPVARVPKPLDEAYIHMIGLAEQ